MTAVAKIEPTRIFRNNVIRDGAKFSKPCLCWHEILSQRLLRERIRLQYKYAWRRWHSGGDPRLWTSPKFEFVLARDIAKCLSVAKWNPNDTDIRIRARHTRAAFSVVLQPAEFRLHSRTRHRNFYSQNHAYIVGLIRGGEAYCGDGTRKFWDTISFDFSFPLAFFSLPLFSILFQFP